LEPNDVRQLYGIQDMQRTIQQRSNIHILR
jgi:hypothetical protein